MTEELCRSIFFEKISRAKAQSAAAFFFAPLRERSSRVEHTSLFAPAALRCDLVVTGWRAGKSQLTGE
jgi:hypothetical protein